MCFKAIKAIKHLWLILLFLQLPAIMKELFLTQIGINIDFQTTGNSLAYKKKRHLITKSHFIIPVEVLKICPNLVKRKHSKPLI